jgi:hypothetical protein
MEIQKVYSIYGIKVESNGDTFEAICLLADRIVYSGKLMSFHTSGFTKTIDGSTSEHHILEKIGGQRNVPEILSTAALRSTESRSTKMGMTELVTIVSHASDRENGDFRSSSGTLATVLINDDDMMPPPPPPCLPPPDLDDDDDILLENNSKKRKRLSSCYSPTHPFLEDRLVYSPGGYQVDEYDPCQPIIEGEEFIQYDPSSIEWYI